MKIDKNPARPPKIGAPGGRISPPATPKKRFPRGKKRRFFPTREKVLPNRCTRRGPPRDPNFRPDPGTPKNEAPGLFSHNFAREAQKMVQKSSKSAYLGRKSGTMTKNLPGPQNRGPRGQNFAHPAPRLPGPPKLGPTRAGFSPHSARGGPKMRASPRGPPKNAPWGPKVPKK